MISSYLGFTASTRTRSLALSAAARNRPPYCIRGVAPTIAMERGLSILWIDAICGSVQNSMTPPEKNVVRRVGKPTHYERGCHRPIFPHHWLKGQQYAPRTTVRDGLSAPKADRGRSTPRRRLLWRTSSRTTSARPSGHAETFGPAGRRSFAPFAVRDHHRAG